MLFRKAALEQTSFAAERARPLLSDSLSVALLQVGHSGDFKTAVAALLRRVEVQAQQSALVNTKIQTRFLEFRKCQ